MRIVHVLHELPFPPNSGIRCDMGRRLQAFRALGHKVFAIGWLPSGPPPALAHVSELERLADEIALLPIGSDWAARARRIGRLAQYPSYIAARIVPISVLRALIARVRVWRPDLIWLEGVHPAWLATKLSHALGVPLAYRSHNIEHRYLAEQARLATSSRQRLALTAGTWGLERAERALHLAAAEVFDISATDLAWWRAQGFANNSWLPPQPDPAILATASAPARDRDIDLLFLGSLSSPNNIAGVEWYLDSVRPLVGDRLGPHRLVFAGRSPSEALARRIADAGCELVADPPDAAALLARGRVMLNPILHGSGINIKTVDMLATGRPVVTTRKGARGLPDEVTAELSIADSAEDFAAAVSASLQKPPTDRTALMERVFGLSAIADALARLPA